MRENRRFVFTVQEVVNRKEGWLRKMEHSNFKLNSVSEVQFYFSTCNPAILNQNFEPVPSGHHEDSWEAPQR